MTSRVTAWLIAIGGTALVTAVGHRMDVNPITVGFAFLIVVLVSAIRGGLPAGAAASILATLCYNFFFFPPFYTFRIADASNWFVLAAFLVTSVVVSRLVIAAQTQADRAERRRTELETLYDLSIELFKVGALGEAAGRALQLLGAREGGLVLFDGSPWRQNVIWWSGEKRDEVEDVIAGIGRHKEPLEFPSPLGRDVYLPLLAGQKTIGALVARGTDASMKALVSASHLVSLAVEREKIIEENAHVQAIRESETLKTSLLRAISHDLTTPLTAITIHTEALRRTSGRAAVEGIVAETARLRRRIDNLLSMAKLEAGRAQPRREPTPPADLFRAVRENLPLVFDDRPVTIRVDADCPDANVDPSLALEILVNLIENAHRASPPGALLELTAHALDAAQVRIEVLDRGAGIADADAGDQRGLGLVIARALAAANGGAIALVPREGGGTVARLDLQAALLPVTESA